MRAFCTVVALGASLIVAQTVNAVVVGAGPAIPLEVVDTPGTGPRTNVDQSFAVILQPGTYEATSFSFAAGQSGDVKPFVAFANGADNYRSVAVGDNQIIPGALTATVPFTSGGKTYFSVTTNGTAIFAGITNSPGVQNPIFLDNGTATLTDHDGTPTPVLVGQTVTGFSNPNLGRTYAFSLDVQAVTLANTAGAGRGIPHEVVDTSGGGPRMNIDEGFTMTLGPGTYRASGFEFSAGQSGSVIPFLAVLNGGNYEVLAVGDTQTVGAGNTEFVGEFGGDDVFTLFATTTVFAGITNPAGSQNPVFLDNGTTRTTDHDGTPLALTGAPGQLISVAGISNQNLGRVYAFAITVESAVPEPATLSLLAMGMAGLLRRRRRPELA